MNKQTPESGNIRTLGQKVNDVTVRLRGIGELLSIAPNNEMMSSETYLDEIIAQVEECRTWLQNIYIELEKL